MPRPKICFCKYIDVSQTKRQFRPSNLGAKTFVELGPEEMEVIRLRNLLIMGQKRSARKLHTSQSTVQRLLSSAYNKIADALINGKTIKIVKCHG